MAIGNYINLHAEIDENGTLNLVDEDGRVLGNVQSKTIKTVHMEPSTATVTILLKQNGRGFTRDRVNQGRE